MKRITLLLKERETVSKDVHWVLNEACNGRSLQSGGTFQNVLARKLDEVIVPVFARILASIDCYYNIDIIYHNLK